MFFLRNPKVCLAFFVVLSMCGDHERASAVVTLRHLAAEALSSSTLFKMYLTFLVMWRTWHLEGLKCISNIFLHCSRQARSVCWPWPSVVELIASYMAVSSAKSLTLDLTCLGRSLVYARKRIENQESISMKS